VPTITGELRRCFRDQGWAVRPPRRVQELRPKLAQAMEALTQQLSSRPTVAELADYLGVSAADVRETQLASSNYHQLSLDAPCGVGQIPLAETVVAQDDPFEQVLRRAAARPILDQLEGRDRRILLLRYLHGWTQQHIAEDIGVTQMQVSRLLTRLQTQLRQLAASS
jgi:RNA polymerase sigma-B factor